MCFPPCQGIAMIPWEERMCALWGQSTSLPSSCQITPKPTIQKIVWIFLILLCASMQPLSSFCTRCHLVHNEPHRYSSKPLLVAYTKQSISTHLQILDCINTSSLISAKLVLGWQKTWQRLSCSLLILWVTSTRYLHYDLIVITTITEYGFFIFFTSTCICINHWIRKFLAKWCVHF